MSSPLPQVTMPRRPRPPRHLADFTPAERRAAAAGLGEPAFRGGQLSRHYFVRLDDDPQHWTDVPAGARERLAEALLPRLLAPVRDLTCDGGTTRKSLWRLFDGALVESVVMRYRADGGRRGALGAEAGPVEAGRGRDRLTVCVSSQAGCGMGCTFCATGQAGLTRSLSTAEIVDQVVAAARAVAHGHMPGGPGRVSNVVFMGMGEPLANYDPVVAAVRRLTDAPPDGLGLSQRGITVSTVGLVPAIGRLAGEGLAVTLAVSLHAPDDELRDQMVPVNRRWPVGELLDAARGYFERTGRRVSIEYALAGGVNDQPWRAELLGELLTARGRGWVHVNPIPLNPTPGSPWTASRPEDEKEFVRRLAAHGIPVTVRDTRGREIDGACGQLAASSA